MNPSKKDRLSRPAMALLILTACTRIGCAGPAGLFRVEVLHRHYPGFHETHLVSMEEEFSIGDTDTVARLVRFEPDFAIDMNTKEVISRSEKMNNPAVQVEVVESGKEPVQVWAFKNLVPHMGGKTPLAFRLLAVDDVFFGEVEDAANSEDDSAADGGVRH